MVAVSVQPFAIGVCSFGVAFVFSLGGHKMLGCVYLAFVIFHSFAVLAAQVAADNYLVIELPSFLVFQCATPVGGIYIPKRVVEVADAFYGCDISVGAQRVPEAYVVGVVVEISHNYNLCRRVALCYGVLDGSNPCCCIFACG